jgi:predicted dithiol-disulfide oxidoreductase (DUF899 family)
MFGPGWEQGCTSCSFMADHTDGMTIHLAHRDVTFVAISRATLPEIGRFKERMGWKFDWVSSSGNDFNRDFHVSFDPEDRVTGSAFVDPRRPTSRSRRSTTTTRSRPSPTLRRRHQRVLEGRRRRGLPHLLRPSAAASR